MDFCFPPVTSFDQGKDLIKESGDLSLPHTSDFSSDFLCDGPFNYRP
jgi:hypothetical protein